MTTDRELTMRIAVLEQKVADLYRRIGQEELGAGADGAAGAGLGNAEDDPKLLALLRENRTIEAIKVYRELTGAGLKEAKKAVERLIALHRPIG